MSSVSTRPRFSSDAARQWLELHYGVRGQLAELPSERDQNFRVETTHGPDLVFKKSRATCWIWARPFA